MKAANIEIKARVRSLTTMLTIAESISDQPVQVMHQEDTFFNTTNGRLKLREIALGSAQLIYYERTDINGPKRSDYHVIETDSPENLKTLLTLALGVRGVVKKTRYLYHLGQTRIHLDDVEGLGHFVELEVVLCAGQSDEKGQAIAEDLMDKLGIIKDDLIEHAYMDLIDRRI